MIFDEFTDVFRWAIRAVGCCEDRCWRERGHESDRDLSGFEEGSRHDSSDASCPTERQRSPCIADFKTREHEIVGRHALIEVQWTGLVSHRSPCPGFRAAVALDHTDVEDEQSQISL